MKMHQARPSYLKGRFLLRNKYPPPSKGASGTHLAQSAVTEAALVPVTCTPFAYAYTNMHTEAHTPKESPSHRSNGILLQALPRVRRLE
jgi:hypothetical protein